MIEKIKSSLFAKVFLITSIILLSVSLSVFGLLAWLMPQSYSNRLNTILDQRAQGFISELEQVPFSDSGGLFDQFISDTEINSVELYNSSGDFVYFLQYQGKTVRWFEDYYTVEDGIQAGNDFFDENGVVDVYAVRDFTSLVRSEDGSFDPSGKLVGVKEFSEAEFAARDVEAIINPPAMAALAGDPPSAKELEGMAKEYEAFGVTYDMKKDQWYFSGEKVRFFRDVLTSNGEDLTSGKFKGTIRTLGSVDGTVDIYTVRDFAHPDASGNGTLTGVEKYSQAEFDEHTQKEMQSSSGFCTVTEE